VAAAARAETRRLVRAGLAHIGPDAAAALREVASEAKAAGLSLLGRYLGAAAGRCERLAQHSDDTAEHELTSALARVWALSEALDQAEGETWRRLRGVARRSFEELGARLRLEPLGASRWANPSGARGMTFWGWDQAAGEVRSAVVARPAGSGRGVRRDLETTEFWGMALRTLLAGPFELDRPRLTSEGDLSPTGGRAHPLDAGVAEESLREAARRLDAARGPAEASRAEPTTLQEPRSELDAGLDVGLGVGPEPRPELEAASGVDSARDPGPALGTETWPGPDPGLNSVPEPGLNSAPEPGSNSGPEPGSELGPATGSLTEQPMSVTLLTAKAFGAAMIDEPAQELVWALELAEERGWFELRQPINQQTMRRIDSVLALAEAGGPVAYVLAVRFLGRGRSHWEPVTVFLRGPDGLRLAALDFGGDLGGEHGDNAGERPAETSLAKQALDLAVRRWRTGAARGGTASGTGWMAGLALCDDVRELVVELVATGRARLSQDQLRRQALAARRLDDLTLATLAGAVRRIDPVPDPADLLRAYHLADRVAALASS
jgi:hypothetical protein